MPDDAKTFMIENAELIFRNFEGKEGPYNVKGERNFSVLLDDENAEQMARDGWPVKFLKPREEGEPERPYIQCKISFANRPPRVVMISSSARTNLNDETVEVLDWADIQTADLICRGYEWSVGGKSGIKPYVQSLFVTINEDFLERKYAINGVAES